MRDTIDYVHVIDDLAFGCRAEVNLELEVIFCPREGDGWNSPRIPAHWEPDGSPRVESVVLYHWDGDWTGVQIGRGSILEAYFLRLLPRDIEDQMLDRELEVY